MQRKVEEITEALTRSGHTIQRCFAVLTSDDGRQEWECIVWYDGVQQGRGVHVNRDTAKVEAESEYAAWRLAYGA